MEKPLPPIPRLHHGFLRVQQLFDRTQGYHFGVIWCAVASGTVCLINIFLTIWGARTYEVSGQVGTIQEGSCNTTKTLATWAHLVINVLSTLLLGASNYSMQCLSSPTRKDVDKAHSRKIWLDIGVPSIRNLIHIAPMRRRMWWTLAISSIPLHLLYNSAIFTTLSAQEYSAFTVTPSLFDGAPVGFATWNNPRNFSTSDDNFRGALELLETLNDTRASPQKMDNAQCVKSYGVDFVSQHSHVMVVSSHTDPGDSVLAWYGTRQPRDPVAHYAWICNNFARTSTEGPDKLPRKCIPTKSGLVPKDSTLERWENSGYKVDYCLSKPVEEHCKLQFNIVIMIVVICCNFLKFAIMAYIPWKRPKTPLVTLGDAVACFLDQPDQKTAVSCLLDQLRVRESRDWSGKPLRWHKTKYRWAESVTVLTWFISLGL